jgi:hypothetical protein
LGGLRQQSSNLGAAHEDDQNGVRLVTYRSPVLWGLAITLSFLWMMVVASLTIAFGKLADAYALAAAMASLLFMLAIMPLKAEELHDHSMMDPNVDKFLQNWKQPYGGEPRKLSCCNNKDCDEVETRPVSGIVEFKSRVTGRWTPIPPSLLEQNQHDTEWSPNGKAWVCQSRVDMHVVCATLGDPGI